MVSPIPSLAFQFYYLFCCAELFVPLVYVWFCFLWAWCCIILKSHWQDPCQGASFQWFLLKGLPSQAPYVSLLFILSSIFCAENEIKIQFHSSQCGYLVSPIPLRDAVISSVWTFWHPCGRKCEHMDMTLSVDYVCSIVLCSYDSASVRQLFVIQFVPGRVISALFLWLLCSFMTLNAYIQFLDFFLWKY